MYIDYENCFCEKQPIVSNAVSTNVLNVGRDCGCGNTVKVKVLVDGEDFAGLSGLRVALQASEDDDFSLFETLYESGSIPVASLVRGYTFPLPSLPDRHPGFLRLNFTVSGGDATSGKVSGYVIMDDQTNR
jgi:hypothetical protein